MPAALDFVNWSTSTGILLLIATIAAVVLSNSALGAEFSAFWTRSVGFAWGDGSFTMPLKMTAWVEGLRCLEAKSVISSEGSAMDDGVDGL